MTHLRLVNESPVERESFEPPSFDLGVQPQRPGELTEPVAVAISDESLKSAKGTAAAARLPLELWLVIAIDAERALTTATLETGVSGPALIAACEAEALAPRPTGLNPPLQRRLADYAMALRIGHTKFAVPEAITSPVILAPAHTTAAGWARAAADAQLRVEQWVAFVAERTSPGRELWEAAAAEAGRHLSEWVLVQAARAARATSTRPQAAA